MVYLLSRFSKGIVVISLIIISNVSFAWGSVGHSIVARLALNIVNEDVKQNVLNYLCNMPIDTTANWMDIMKSNSDHDFMCPWHYVNFAKGTNYKVNNDENIINRLLITYNDLLHKSTLCYAQIKTDLLILFHLMGDLHMPLHTGYDDDLGGNKVIIQYDTMKSHSLHRFWDKDIFRLGGIIYADCLNYYTQQAQNSHFNNQKIDFISCMVQSRELLNEVYNFPGYILNENYLAKNKIILTQQLMLAGVHLAEVLNKLFTTPAKSIDFNAKVATFKNGIPAAAASAIVSKKVTVCEKVYIVSFTDKIT